MQEEKTEKILNFPGYFVDRYGNVYSAWRRKRSVKGLGFESYISDDLRKLKPQKDKSGYLYVFLHKNRKRYVRKIHRLILETFVGPCPKGMQACHNNGIRDDNRLENLRWDTLSNNQKDRIKHGTSCKGKIYNEGERCVHAKLTEEEVLKIRYLYSTENYTQINIAKLYNMSTSQINKIINYKVWRYNFKRKVI